MQQNYSRFLTIMLAAFGVFFALLLLLVNSSLAKLAEWLYPGSALAAQLGLIVVEVLALVWFWRGLFGRHRHLLLMQRDDPESRKRFADEFTRRMKKNIHLRDAGLAPEDPAYLEKSIAILNDKANAEINRTARRVFLATALSQNGKLDALIVFVCLCRLVWRISGIYNQQPHPREVISLYWAVVTGTFLALSFEELDLGTEISVSFGESFQAAAPAGITSSIPFAGKALQTFTSSAIDGAANCFLTLRAGIITRNAYVYRAQQEDIPSRAAVFRESGSILLEMSASLMEKLAGAVADNLVGLARYAGRQTARAGKGLAVGTAEAVQRGGQGIARGVSSTGRGAGRALSSFGALLARPFTWAYGRTFGKKKKPEEAAEDPLAYLKNR